MVEASASISQDADCSKRRYHPKKILDNTCTNDEDFPDAWRDVLTMETPFLARWWTFVLHQLISDDVS